MDMTRHLKRWLNNAELVRRGDTYEGVIASVTEEEVRNRFTAQRELHPIIDFADGWRLIPNLTMRRALVELFGPETDSWTGRRIKIVRRCISRTDTGERYGKAVICEDRHAYESPRSASSIVRTPGDNLSTTDVDDELVADDIFGRSRFDQ